MNKLGIAIAMGLLLLSCDNSVKKDTVSLEVTDQSLKEVIETKEVKKTEEEIKGSAIIVNAIEAHGGILYDTADYSFVFRKKQYHFTNNGSEFTYEVKTGNTKDVIVNGVFTRFVNDEVNNLSEKDVSKYSQALNSVIYFATLPHKLSDVAVNKSYEGSTTIKEERYDVVKVFFNEDGGGTDHDDIYYYWINTETSLIDYFAYNYTVNGGGARFRSYYNRRNVDGITFQDYINWGADKDADLSTLPGLFEKGALKEFSKIETEQVKNLKN